MAGKDNVYKRLKLPGDRTPTPPPRPKSPNPGRHKMRKRPRSPSPSEEVAPPSPVKKMFSIFTRPFKGAKTLVMSRSPSPARRASSSGTKATSANAPSSPTPTSQPAKGSTNANVSPSSPTTTSQPAKGNANANASSSSPTTITQPAKGNVNANASPTGMPCGGGISKAKTDKQRKAKTPRITPAFCKEVEKQHKDLKTSALTDIPIMTYPRDVNLFLWPYTVADCFKHIWLDKAVQVAYQQMIAFLQIIIIAISTLPIVDWVARIAPYTGGLTCKYLWMALDESAGYYKRLNDVRTEEIQTRFKKDLGIVRLNPSKAIKAFTRNYKEKDVHPDVWAAVQAAKKGQAPSLPTGVQFPRLLFPDHSSYKYYSHSADHCAQHLKDNLEDLRAAVKSLAAEDPSTAAFMSDNVLTHVLFNLLEGDAKRAGWLRLRRLPRKVRDAALRKWAFLDPKDTVFMDLIFSGTTVTELKEASKANTAKLNETGAFQNAPQPLRKGKKTVLAMRCHDAAKHSGKSHTPAYQNLFRKLYAAFSYLLRGQHKCARCNHTVYLEGLTTLGKKVFGIYYQNVNVFNVSFDRTIPGCRGEPYDNIPNVAATCWGCNCLKATARLNDFMILLGKLAEEAVVELNKDGLLCPPPLAPRHITAQEDKMLWKWAFDKMEAPWRKRGRKVGDLTVGQLYRKAKEAYVGRGLFRDPTGLHLPLHMAAIDRIDPKGKYDDKNTRLLYGPLNFLRSNHPTDEPLREYVLGIRDTVDFEAIRKLQDSGLAFLPGLHAALRRAGAPPSEYGEIDEVDDELWDDEAGMDEPVGGEVAGAVDEDERVASVLAAVGIEEDDDEEAFEDGEGMEEDVEGMEGDGEELEGDGGEDVEGESFAAGMEGMEEDDDDA